MHIKYVKLTPTELAVICPILSIGNQHLRSVAEIFDVKKKEIRAFRGKLFSDIKIGKFNKLDISSLNPEQRKKLGAAIPHIWKAMQYETRIMHGYANLVRKHAHAISRNAVDAKESYKDFEQEGFLGVIDGMYGFDINANTKLITYVWRCVRNALFKLANKNNPLRPLTNQALSLVETFNHAKERLVTLGPISDEEVINQLEMSDDEKEILRDATRKVVDCSQLNKEVATDRDDDYTGFRRDVDNDVVEVFLERKEVRQAFKDANLLPVELELLLAQAFPYPGWREHVASNHINPRTGTRYTREAARLTLLEAARRKVTEAMRRPSKVPVHNVDIDRAFDDLAGRYAK